MDPDPSNKRKIRIDLASDDDSSDSSADSDKKVNSGGKMYLRWIRDVESTDRGTFSNQNSAFLKKTIFVKSHWLCAFVCYVWILNHHNDKSRKGPCSLLWIRSIRVSLFAVNGPNDEVPHSQRNGESQSILRSEWKRYVFFPVNVICSGCVRSSELGSRALNSMLSSDFLSA